MAKQMNCSIRVVMINMGVLMYLDSEYMTSFSTVLTMYSTYYSECHDFTVMIKPKEVVISVDRIAVTIAKLYRFSRGEGIIFRQVVTGDGGSRHD